MHSIHASACSLNSCLQLFVVEVLLKSVYQCKWAVGAARFMLHSNISRPVTRGVRWVRTNPPLSLECNLPEGFPLCGELAAKYIVSARARAVLIVTLLNSDCTSLGTRPIYLVSYPDGLRISWGATPRVLVRTGRRARYQRSKAGLRDMKRQRAPGIQV